MNEISAASTPFWVADTRSLFTAVSIGWRMPSRDALQRTKSLREMLGGELSLQRRRTAQVITEWTVSDGGECMTAALPRGLLMTWLRDVLERARALGIGEGYISVVGSPDELGEAEAQVIASASHASATVPILSSMRQTKLQGYQKTIVLGTDPAMDIGAAETFIAICLATAGRDAIVPATIRRHRLNGTMQLSRGLKEGSPALIWQTIAQEDHSASLLEHCLDAVAHYRVLQNPDALIRTMRFARTNLARPWRSPFELARTLTQYEVMGWDGRLVRLPEDMLARVEEAGIERALAALIQPLNEVLGRR